MHKLLYGFAGLMLGLVTTAANAQDTVKIGIIMSYSGQFADTAAQIDNAIKLYMKQHGDTVAGKKIELIRKDTGGIAPEVAKRLAQELIVRDNADILAGFALTPNALAAADVSARGEEVHGGDERRHLDHHHQVALPGAHLGDDAAVQRARSAPGRPSTASRRSTRWCPTTGRASTPKALSTPASRKRAARSSGSVRFPVANPDFSAFVQRAKDANPDAIYIWVPGGAQPAAVGKALAERGIDRRRSKILGQDAIAEETR